MQSLHQFLVMNRRVRVLAQHLARLLPPGQTLTGLDVGCGSGEIAIALQHNLPGLTLEGVDVLVRPNPHIPVREFDGDTLPYADNSVDVVLLVDVLHHTHHPEKLLRECTRVARHHVLIKDHTCDSRFDRLRLRWMDWVGNRGHGVSLPYNYLSSRQWRQLFQDLGWLPEVRRTRLALYPPPLTYLFDADLHFVTRLAPMGTPAAAPRRTSSADA